MPKGETAMIKLEKVSKIFHSGGKEIPAVQDVTLDIQEGVSVYRCHCWVSVLV